MDKIIEMRDGDEPRPEQENPLVRFFNQDYAWWRNIYGDDHPRGFFSFEMRKRMELVVGAARAFISRTPGCRVLDCGCGSGEIIAALHGLGGKLWGVDINGAHLELARRTAGPQVHLSVGDVQNLPFSAASFDLVLCIGVTSYLPGDETALWEISRVVRPGGKVILGLPNLAPSQMWLDPYYYFCRAGSWWRQGIRSQGEKTPPANFKKSMIRRYRYHQLDRVYRRTGLHRAQTAGVSYGPLTVCHRHLLPQPWTERLSETLRKGSEGWALSWLKTVANHWVITLEKG